MKKILLACFMALGITSNAQYNYTGDFEGGENPGPGYAQFGGGAVVASAACNGAFGGEIAISNTYTNSGWMVDTSDLPQTGNGQKVSLSASYKKPAGFVGTISLAYFVYNDATDNWTVYPLGTATSLTAPAITSCTTLTATIPTGTLQPSQKIGFGVWIVKPASGGVNGSVYVDDITISQEIVNSAPACTSLVTPVEGSTISGGTGLFTWASADKAVNYKLTVGTTSGASDLYNGTVAGTSANVPLPTNKTLFAKLVPSNNVGDATGCTEVSFSTNDQIAYCGPIITTLPGSAYPISAVTFAGKGPNTSSATVGSVGYENFTSYVFDAVAGNTYPLLVSGTGLGANRFGMTVWIDWNNNGNFDDAGEQYFVAPGTLLGGTGAVVNLTGNISVPASATLGNKRMRIKYNFSSSTTALHEALSTACTNMGNGQTEDYTINVIERTLPSCTSVTALPLQAPNTTLTWVQDTMATGYKVYVGSTPGATDIANGVVVSTLSFMINGLQRNTTYYAKVVPTNNLGDASGCAEISFTTPANWTYCAATHTTVNADRISNVAFANINNPSALTTVPGGYEDFTAVIGNVVVNGMYPMTITAASGNANDKVKVWIDYNQNGVFEDSEMTLLTYSSVTSSAGNITIPSDALLGNTRMRIRLARQANAASIVACGNIAGQGRTQDYTINVAAPNQATASVSKNSVSVYPNPFQDVLKISDVKGVKSISVSDVSGRQVKNMKPAAELNLSDLKTGLYIVTLYMEDGTVKSVKAIKK
ncbi:MULTISPECIES: GEVED domain-containing protein [unclassified Kaistella]|uniref:GEVED domain-containing protein n=1 Tax=unclassified Kaistella TaxID=2762626 RepID=UPI0027357989|nr:MULTISPECIES: GEVED domain-containing protein [unclassified Kaistella]MDP2453427.1 GEVED domain-containing protein [Kaistella sp. SH11-4b]MDP2456484.1 GEVED domain-containing protein [Kaistella sp. SH40-3]MDP2459240.1 GEVED domain-containing protein [Kaistella sp. SH19-2b]